MLVHTVVAALSFQAPVSKVQQAAAAAGVACAIAFATPAFAGNAAEGSAVFEGNCAACHAGGMNVIMPEKTLEKEVRPPSHALSFHLLAPPYFG